MHDHAKFHLLVVQEGGVEGSEDTVTLRAHIMPSWESGPPQPLSFDVLWANNFFSHQKGISVYIISIA